jgi:peptide/nickel transport system permease protein
MFRYIARRLILLIPVLLGISILVFVILRLLPGDPAYAILGPNAKPTDVKAIHTFLGLDKPIVVQYFEWLGRALQGDLGRSFFYHVSVTEKIRTHLPVTIELVLMATLLSVAVGIPAGIISAIKQNSWLDLAARTITVGALSIPSFWLGTLMLLLPSLWWHYAPPVGYVPLWKSPSTNLQQFYMPAIALAAASAAAVMRMTRSSVLEVMGADYVRTARAKGLRERRVVWRHVLKNAMIPVLSLVGLQIGILLGGQVVVEQIFTLPGIGRLLIDSIFQRDYFLVQAIVLYIAIAVVLINLLVDLLYAALEPRIKYS